MVNGVLTPTAEAIAYYRGLLATMEEAERQGTAAVTYQDATVDIAMVKTVRQVLAFVHALGALDPGEK